MEMEARSFSADKSRSLLVKVKDYKADLAALRRRFKGAYMANNGYDRTMAQNAIGAGVADLIAFGRPFIANPDLVERLRRNAPLNVGDHTTYFGGSKKGYTDYPTLADASGG